MRLIDADALKNSIPTTYVDIFENCRNCSLLSEEDVRRLVDGTPTVTQWISVKDRMPGIDEDVLILYESKVSRKTGCAITCLKDSFYFGSTQIPYQTPQWNEPWQYFRENNVITHWMPLPEPPKEVKQDGEENN